MNRDLEQTAVIGSDQVRFEGTVEHTFPLKPRDCGLDFYGPGTGPIQNRYGDGDIHLEGSERVHALTVGSHLVRVITDYHPQSSGQNSEPKQHRVYGLPTGLTLHRTGRDGIERFTQYHTPVVPDSEAIVKQQVMNKLGDAPVVFVRSPSTHSPSVRTYSR